MKKFWILVILTLFIYGCSPANLLVYQPQASSNTFFYYQKGLPIIAVESESEFLILSVEESQILGKTCLRVWLLCESKTEEPYLVEPYEMIKLRAEKNGSHYKEYLAESPTKILNQLKENEAIALTLQAIGGALQEMSVKDTKIQSSQNLNNYTVTDKDEKRRAHARANREDLRATAEWYETFQYSFAMGVLRKHTLFADQSANGYIYFILDEIKPSSFTKLEDFIFTLRIKAKSVNKDVILEPVAIW